MPERSLANSVVYESEDALADAVEELAALYEDAGVLAWTVWVPEYHERAAGLLERAGHRLDANPAAMIAELSELEPPRDDDPEPDPAPTRDDLGVINDLAYRSGDAFKRLLGTGPADPSHTYIAWVDGRPAASVVSHDHEGDCSIWWVATIPEASRPRPGPALMRRALADGKARAARSPRSRPPSSDSLSYERLGYRNLGEIQMWERRKSPAAGGGASPA